MSDRIHTILDRQVAAQPDAPALTDTLGHIWNYDELASASNDLTNKLTQLGVRRNDRIMILMENCAAALAAIFAASRIGAAFIPVNARQSATEIARVITHADPAAILFTAEVSDEARAHANELGATPLHLGLHVLARVSNPEDVLEDVATILYTTGTTGTPKGVMLTHANLIFGGQATRETRQLQSSDILYGVLPISHVFGLVSVLMGAMVSGASIRLEPRFAPATLYQALTSGLTILFAVPQMHALLMQYTKEQGHDQLPSDTLRYVSSGAAPLDPDWKRRAEAFYGIPLQNGYGMTETSAGVCVTRHADNNDDISVGPPSPGVRVKLDLEAPGAEGDVGEILVAGGGVMQGYFRNPDDTAQVFTSDGWLRTGDLGMIDDVSHLHIKGRSKELIIHGGFNVYPPEVEAALNDHPQVIQCAVIGHAEDGDEKVYAFVEAARDDWPDEDALRQFAAARLTGYKRPSRIILTERLPAAATGKILKHKLLDLLKS
ncbi:class I adenylate-forming enzyme family protein [Yoonia sp. SDW83-1]|uniref:class I adenylate-forming enzyme family protein n=1 Tax=Yoonia sp. SDW83-1 TaxID=3366945 RepID=UPI00398C5E18